MLTSYEYLSEYLSMFDNKLSEKYLRKRRDKAIGSATATVFWAAAIMIAGGAVYKAAITDSGRDQLAHLMGQQNVIALLGDRPSKLEELQRQVFAQTRLRDEGVDNIMTGSISHTEQNNTSMTLQPVGNQIHTGSIRPSASLPASPDINYIVELANSNSIAPLRDTLHALRKSHPNVVEQGFPNIRRHITSEYPAGRYFLYLQKYTRPDFAFETCNAYLRVGVPCATTAVSNIQKNMPIVAQ